MKLLMDADCLIKLTKSTLKELVCSNFSVIIPQVVKEEVIDNARKHPDSVIIKKNLENKLLRTSKLPSSSQKGEEAILTIFQQGKFDAVCTDDKRFIKRLRLFEIPYITPAVFITLLLINKKLSIQDAFEKLDLLSPFVSDDEYNAVKIVLENRRI